MLHCTRPIQVSESTSNEVNSPVTLNLLKSGLIGAPMPAAATAAKPEAAPRRQETRKVELPQCRLDLSERRDAKGQFDLSDAAAKIRQAPGVKPGAGNVEQFAFVLDKPSMSATESVVDKKPESKPETPSDREEPTIHSAALARVTHSWPRLNPSIQAAILAMVEAVEAGLDDTRS